MKPHHFLLICGLILLGNPVAEASDRYSWLENMGYPFRIGIKIPKAKVICFGKVRDSVTRLVHTVACHTSSKDECPVAEACKQGTSYNFEVKVRSESHFKLDSILTIKNEQNNQAILQSKKDELYNTVFTLGLINGEKNIEVSSISMAEHKYFKSVFEQTLGSFERLSDGVNCGRKNVFTTIDSKNSCFKCAQEKTCLEEEFVLYEKFLVGKKNSEYFLISNLLK